MRCAGQRVTFNPVGYLIGVRNDAWSVVYAPGLRFEYTDMPGMLMVTRVGEIRPTSPDHVADYPQYLVEMALKDALKNAVYNRKNTASWLISTTTISMALRLQSGESRGMTLFASKRPEEVIDTWRQ